MVYYIGDIHGKVTKVLNAVKNCGITRNDVIVILGDAGINYGGNDRGDACVKRTLNDTGITIFSIHGNHERRPASIPTYKTKEWRGGTVWFEEDYPNLLFAKDGCIFDLEGRRTMVIGGAYSVDKFFRLETGAKWFPDEQPSPEIRIQVENALEAEGWQIDQVISHTCPAKFTPIEAFIPWLDQSTVDRSTEEWLDAIEDKLTYQRWLCGHWHIDKAVGDFRFVMEDVVV